MNEEEAQREYDRIIDWVIKKENKRVEELKREGKYRGGLDGDNKAFADIYAERNRRIALLIKKYKEENNGKV